MSRRARAIAARRQAIEDERDVGIRPCAAKVLGLEDPERDVIREFRRRAWVWLQRDPETGLPPFGVFV